MRSVIYGRKQNESEKRIFIVTFLVVFMLAGCGQATDNTSSGGTAQNSGSAEQENESGGQTEIAEGGNSGQAEVLEGGNDETGEDTSVPGTISPAVYMTADISPEGLMAVYEALGWTPSGNVAVKLSTGEPPASNYLRPELIVDLVQFVDGTIVECNTAYGGSRAETAMHYQVAEDHGFTAIADFQIQDEDGSMILSVEGGTRLTDNYVGAAFADYDSYLILSHFKGHAMACFGGAIKNISIGLGSGEGKCWIHSGGTSLTSPWGGEQDGDGASLINRIESRNGLHALEHAEEIGLGSRTYELVSVDE